MPRAARLPTALVLAPTTANTARKSTNDRVFKLEKAKLEDSEGCFLAAPFSRLDKSRDVRKLDARMIRRIDHSCQPQEWHVRNQDLHVRPTSLGVLAHLNVYTVSTRIPSVVVLAWEIEYGLCMEKRLGSLCFDVQFKVHASD